MRVSPLAFESFGVRGMATCIETDDVKMIIDPGSALGPRFRLRPHEREYVALYESRRRILSAARDADLLSISHYHFDHFVPNFENWKFIWSSPEMAEELYRDKLILAKDISENINTSQRKRGYMFRKKNIDFAEEIRVADGHELEVGSTGLRFSEPVYHGPEGTKLGFSLVLTVETPNFTLVHAPDVQGPMYGESLGHILSQSPDLLIIGGPPTYISFKLEDEDLSNARKNLVEIAKKVPKLVVDHHLLRTTEYPEFLSPVVEAAERSGHKVLTASELVGEGPRLLEARRKELHEEEPIEEEWYERLEEGELGEGLEEG
ncbi:hypothetical protein AKJ63_00070 [candidate division MSBL1 archaeon SCGC-AAA259D18]|uniref:UPF0282 protein AKJ57_01615 n=2 Tax=candidate division MSBL1 TaxID=215777 RepID=A0A133UAW2_9EURY|nr:hypothetical protein AKJ57_01615 [candidate division MSBL1 archaeon SCGC-AAA259A05]KXA92017.1 hypothetical protein AKJ63_00070 [candidate division MSBL1 archaeon SCGC-AAA259D18]